MSRPIQIDAGAGTEVVLTNQDFSTVLRGYETLRQADVAPDLYKLTVRAGNTSQDYDVMLTDTAAKLLPGSMSSSSDGDAPPPPVVTSDASGVKITIPPPRFTAAAPLYGTSKSHEYQGSFVTNLSQRRTLTCGAGASVLLVSRTWRRDPSQALLDPATGVTLCDEAGKVIADLARGGERSVAGDDPAVACSVELDPGWYRLRVARPGMPVVEQAVVVSKGWQTQVFLLRQTTSQRDTDRLKLSMSMARIDSGRPPFQPTDDDLRRTELALQGLQRGRPVASKDELETMLRMKPQDPLLAIFAAAQLDDSAPPDLLHEVVSNLRMLVGGDHPDVEALALRVPGLAPGARFPRPPMLLASWRRIVARSADDPDVVPADSLAEDIGTRLYGVGAWLWWTTEPSGSGLDRPRTRSGPPTNFEGFESLRPTALRQLLTGTSRGPVQSSSPYTLALQSMIPSSPVAADDAPAIEQQVIRALGVPRSLVERAAQELLDAAPAVVAKVTAKAAPMAKKKPVVVVVKKSSTAKKAKKRSSSPAKSSWTGPAKYSAAKKPTRKGKKAAKKTAKPATRKGKGTSKGRR